MPYPKKREESKETINDQEYRDFLRDFINTFKDKYPDSDKIRELEEAYYSMQGKINIDDYY